jgi:hypothetical protein
MQTEKKVNFDINHEQYLFTNHLDSIKDTTKGNFIDWLLFIYLHFKFSFKKIVTNMYYIFFYKEYVYVTNTERIYVTWAWEILLKLMNKSDTYMDRFERTIQFSTITQWYRFKFDKNYSEIRRKKKRMNFSFFRGKYLFVVYSHNNSTSPFFFAFVCCHWISMLSIQKKKASEFFNKRKRSSHSFTFIITNDFQIKH